MEFLDEILRIIRNTVGPDVPAGSIASEPLDVYADEEQVSEILSGIEETFEVVFDEDDLDQVSEMTLDQLVNRVTELGGKLPE